MRIRLSWAAMPAGVCSGRAVMLWRERDEGTTSRGMFVSRLLAPSSRPGPSGSCEQHTLDSFVFTGIIQRMGSQTTGNN